MSIIANSVKNFELSRLDAFSYCYNTKRHFALLVGLWYLVTGRHVTVTPVKLQNMIWPYRECYFVKTFLNVRNIKLAPIVAKFSPTQSYTNSCGAQAIRLCGYELGITHLPKNSVYQFNGQSITERSAEQALYGITGNLLSPDRTTCMVRPEEGGISLPDGILSAAHMLGLGTKLYCPSLFLRTYLKLAHSKEYKAANTLATVASCSPPKLTLNERYIRAVKDKNSANLHWVVQRPDGSIYDPGQGTNYISMKQFSKSERYAPCGVDLLISNLDGYSPFKMPERVDGA